MAERKHYREIVQTFKAIGLYPEKRPDLPGLTASGRPDYCIYGAPQIGELGTHFWVEVKGAPGDGKNLPFSSISDDQRDWLSFGPRIAGRRANQEIKFDRRWANKCWLWIFFGQRIRSKDNPRAAYLLPWTKWLRVERRFTNHGLRGMAYLQPHNLEHRELGLSAVEALAPFALEWAGSSTWTIPARHCAWITLRRMGASQLLTEVEVRQKQRLSVQAAAR